HGAVEVDVDDRDVVGGDFGADDAAGVRDETEAAAGTAPARGCVVELRDEAAGDEVLGDLGDGRRADVQAPGDLGAGGRSAGAQQAEDRGGDEVAAGRRGRGGHRNSFVHTFI